MLEAANFDPLRAQQLEAELSQEWWERWLLDRNLRPAPQATQSAPGSAPRGPRGRRAPVRITTPPHQATQRVAIQMTPDGQLIPA